MKIFLRLILVFFSIIIFLELLQFLTKTPFLAKYISKLDKINKANIDSLAVLTAYTTQDIPDDYATMVGYKSSTNTNILKFIQTINFKYRPPISTFLFENKYLIQVTCVDRSTSVNLKKDLLQSFNNSEPDDNVGYALDYDGSLKFEYNNSRKSKPSKIILSLNGEHTELLRKTDSLLYYFSIVKNFSIRYNVNVHQDLFASTNLAGASIEILFCRKGNNLYFITATVNNNKLNLDKFILFNLIYK